MAGEPAGSSWPSSPPPPAGVGWNWELSSVAELPRVRQDLRRGLAAAAGGPTAAELDEAVVLAFDEMASNALRHGGGRVRATVRPLAGAWLVEVRDGAADTPPTPAVGRDPSEGGLGLYLIAELASDHGWYVTGGTKHVWAVLR